MNEFIHCRKYSGERTNDFIYLEVEGTSCTKETTSYRKKHERTKNNYKGRLHMALDNNIAYYK